MSIKNKSIETIESLNAVATLSPQETFLLNLRAKAESLLAETAVNDRNAPATARYSAVARVLNGARGDARVQAALSVLPHGLFSSVKGGTKARIFTAHTVLALLGEEHNAKVASDVLGF